MCSRIINIAQVYKVPGRCSCNVAKRCFYNAFLSIPAGHAVLSVRGQKKRKVKTLFFFQTAFFYQLLFLSFLELGK